VGGWLWCIEIGEGGTNGKASKIESVVDVRREDASELRDIRESMTSSNDRGTPCAGGVSCSDVRKSPVDNAGSTCVDVPLTRAAIGRTSWIRVAFPIFATMDPALEIALTGRLSSGMACVSTMFDARGVPKVEAEAEVEGLAFESANGSMTSDLSSSLFSTVK